MHDAIIELISQLCVDQEKERRHIIDIGGPSGTRNGLPVSIALARNDIRMEVIDKLEILLERHPFRR